METIPTPPNPFLDDFGALVLPALEEWFFVPGDWIIYLLVSRLPTIADVLVVGPADYGGTLAAFLSWVCWVALAIASIAAVAAVRHFDRAVTGSIVLAVAELRRRVRMALAFARYRRQRRGAERKEPSFDVTELPSLSRE